MTDEGYRSPLTPGGLLGCAATLPFFFIAFALFEDALHSAMPWWHWLIFWTGLIAVPAAILAAVKWCVDRAMADRSQAAPPASRRRERGEPELVDDESVEKR